VCVCVCVCVCVSVEREAGEKNSEEKRENKRNSLLYVRRCMRNGYADTSGCVFMRMCGLQKTEDLCGWKEIEKRPKKERREREREKVEN
jgi:hypothetical protein